MSWLSKLANEVPWKEPWQMTREEFIAWHKTGHISPSAYTGAHEYNLKRRHGSLYFHGRNRRTRSTPILLQKCRTAA